MLLHRYWSPRPAARTGATRPPGVTSFLGLFLSGGGRRFKREDLDALLKPGRLAEKLGDMHRQMQVHMKARGPYTNAFRDLADLVSQVSSGSSAVRELLLQPGLDRAIRAALGGVTTAEEQLAAEAAHLLRERAAQESEQ